MRLPARGTSLQAGAFYTNPDFEPIIWFEVDEGWTHVQRTTGFFDIQDVPGSLDVVAVQFANVVGAETAAVAAQQIVVRDDLVIEGPTEVEIDGRSAIRLTIESTDPLDTHPPVFHPVLDVAAGPLSIASGRRLQVNLLDVDGGVLAILVGGSIAKWNRALRSSGPVLEHVRILD